jgi:dihydroorotate dehydrogenase
VSPSCGRSSRPPSRPGHEELRTEAFGLRMHGPFGLAAGFDKNAVAIDGMSMLGFDHVEIGTVTGEPQPGNPKKRLFRLCRTAR